MKGTTYWIPQAIRNSVTKESCGICHYCKCKAVKAVVNTRGILQFFGRDRRVFHLDHKVPICVGGKHEKNNLVMACATCNLSKRKRRTENDPAVIALMRSINDK